jgi:hypothetical protein
MQDNIIAVIIQAAKMHVNSQGLRSGIVKNIVLLSEAVFMKYLNVSQQKNLQLGDHELASGD